MAIENGVSHSPKELTAEQAWQVASISLPKGTHVRFGCLDDSGCEILQRDSFVTILAERQQGGDGHLAIAMNDRANGQDVSRNFFVGLGVVTNSFLTEMALQKQQVEKVKQKMRDERRTRTLTPKEFAEELKGPVAMERTVTFLLGMKIWESEPKMKRTLETALDELAKANDVGYFDS